VTPLGCRGGGAEVRDHTAGRAERGAAHSLICMRAVQITRFGGPEVMDVVDISEPVAAPGQQLYEVSAAGVNFADTHHPTSLH